MFQVCFGNYDHVKRTKKQYLMDQNDLECGPDRLVWLDRDQFIGNRGRDSL